jgi:hypothetical protein
MNLQFGQKIFEKIFLLPTIPDKLFSNQKLFINFSTHLMPLRRKLFIE